jgi:ribonucleotide reductase, class II
MSIKALQDYTYYSKYARYNKKEGRRETWQEAVDRVKAMHLRRYPNLANDIEWAFDLVKQKRVLGSQRALQFGGEPIEKKHARLYNCCSSYCDRIRFFQECLWLLLCGCGTGFSAQKHHIAKLPNFYKNNPGNQKLEQRIFQIPDTIEGWADALGILLTTYMPHEEFKDWKNYEAKFEYTKIRPAGSYLSSGAGKAPGPEPLRLAIERIRSLLNRCVTNEQKQLRSVDAYDIVMHSSDAVLSGGVRRSATICIFSPDDEDMATAKTGNWMTDNPQRGRSNNSALLIRNQTSKEQFMELIKSVKEYGEPGFFWADDTESLFNPCVTDDTWIFTSNGPRQVKDLIHKPFLAIVDDKTFESSGFFKTGTKSVKKVMLANGMSFRATGNHKVLVVIHQNKKMQRTAWKTVDELTSLDNVVLHNHRGLEWSGSGSLDEGWLLGNFFGDGTRTIVEERGMLHLDYWGSTCFEMQKLAVERLHNSVGGRSNLRGCIIGDQKVRVSSSRLYELADQYGLLDPYKQITSQIETTSSDFHIGFLRGWFDADGSVQGSQLKGISVRLSSTNLNGLHVAQRMLARLGIISTIYPNRRPAGPRLLPDGKNGYKTYNCQADHELVIANDNLQSFSQTVGFDDPEKQNKLESVLGKYKRKLNRERFASCVLNVTEEDVEEDVYDCKVSDVHAFDGNGCMLHNCGEINFLAYDGDGNSGWAFCNLAEINGKKIKCEEDFALAARAASIIGTLQAGYTDFSYLGDVTKRIVEKEALLGVSITGMMDNPDIIFNPRIQRKMARLVMKTNEKFAALIGINPAARCTCIKPSGTTSCLLGSSSGVHPHHAKRYFRRTQANHLEPVLQYYKQFNSIAVEKSVWGANNTDEIVTFAVEVDGKTKNDLSALQLLEYVRSTQQNWVAFGKKKERCAKDWLMHNVSNTINVRENEWTDVANYIYENRKYFSGVSLIPESGDLDYPQAPMVNVLTAREIIQKYGDGSLLASGLIVDGVHAFGDLWVACDAATGLGVGLEEPIQPNGNSTLEDHRQWKIQHDSWLLKVDWIRRVQQFAKRYCENDMRKSIYLMKHVHCWKQWLDIRRECVEVDYTQLHEAEDVTRPLDTVACSGGACSIL